MRGNGFTFNAPGGWKVTPGKRAATAAHDSELLQVSTFPLMKPFDDSLFGAVKTELDARMKTVAAQLKGTVSGSRTVTAGGGRAHSYDVEAGKDVLRYTFVLRGLKEYELLCRRPAAKSDDPCKQLLTSFAPA